eukprot:10381348-Alexandrium_andersonii.AAC.1
MDADHGSERAMQWGKTLRAKCGMHIAREDSGFSDYFRSVGEDQRRMEDLGPNEEVKSTWASYKRAVLKPKRWIDGVGILASAETLGVR